MRAPLFAAPPSIEVIRDERTHDGRWHRLIVLVDGQAVAYRRQRDRWWSCRTCFIRSHAACEHVALVKEYLQ